MSGDNVAAALVIGRVRGRTEYGHMLFWDTDKMTITSEI